MTVSWHDVTALSEAHERLLAGMPVGSVVRDPIQASWRRCRSLGLEPDHRGNLPYQQDPDDVFTLADAARPVLEDLESRLSGIRMTVLLSDEHARVLQRRVGEPPLNRYLDSIQLAPGFAIPEEVIGTNGIGTALATRRPAFVCGREHYSDHWRDIACAGAPVRDPLSGHVIGVLDLTCLRVHSQSSMLAMALDAAHDIETQLLRRATSRERALLQAVHAARRRTTTGGPVRPGTPAADMLDSHDQRILEESADGLISLGRAGLAEVQLPRGRTAVLHCRPVTSPSGVTGFAVEAVIPPGVMHRLTPTEHEAAPPDTTPRFPSPRGRPVVVESPEMAAFPATGPPAEPSTRTDPWLLAVGEPGIVRLAARARERLGLLYDASACVGTTLDVTRTAEELTELVAPRFADFAAVDLPPAVLLGEEPIRVDGPLRRAAITGIHEDSPLYAAGDLVTFAASTPQARSLTSEDPVLEPELVKAAGWLAHDRSGGEKVLDAGVHSLITVPMRARGTVLGVVSFYRSRLQEPFDDDDLSLAEEFVGRAALCIDNARRFTREHAVALALQRSLLPRGLPAQRAVEAAHRYLPARSGVGGDWFDVIPLSGARVALVVGDVVGHGLHAAATMGRLRTAVHNFSSLDLAVDEVLAHLDDLVARLQLDQQEAEKGSQGETAGQEIIGGSCLYAVYDPTTRRCTLARAGHPPPALVLPDGTVEYLELPAGPPLGLGGHPFETAEVDVPEGSLLVLYTDGLLEHIGDRDVALGLDQLRRLLAHPARTPEQTCLALDALMTTHPDDDVAVLVARTRALDADHVATWDVPAEPAVVSRIRSEVISQLTRWGLEELAYTTALTTSELVTNAIRYGGEPITLRLVRDRTLICEVSDGSSTSPHLRRAHTTDEGGRGLYLVAQLVQRWGTRYGAHGKIIWTEQPLKPLRNRPVAFDAALPIEAI
ncbi:SpoIIE family protein phosphatase [Streptomyces sp. NPDC047108]|uniref:SpoIIE family protein phosphatase n=1 Tax=Streptomyces sp. NPDC047108 TaxID=3155025 RepID=UPI00340805DC